MDPLSISVSAAGLATLVYSILHRLNHVVETMKKRKEATCELLSAMQRMHLLLEQVSGLTQQARSVHVDSLSTTFDSAECEKVLDRIKGLTDKVSSLSKFGDFGKDAKYLFYDSVVRELIVNLKDRETHVRTMLLLVCTQTGLKTHMDMKETFQSIEIKAEVKPAFE